MHSTLPILFLFDRKMSYVTCFLNLIVYDAYYKQLNYFLTISNFIHILII